MKCSEFFNLDIFYQLSLLLQRTSSVSIVYRLNESKWARSQDLMFGKSFCSALIIYNEYFFGSVKEYDLRVMFYRDYPFTFFETAMLLGWVFVSN